MAKLLRNNEWKALSERAWDARKHSYVFGNTKVGAALLTENGKIYSGCNIEHIFRSHDIHAEVNAISNMIADGERNIKKILVVAEREYFTPCGSCMDWIIQFSKDNTQVGFQNNKENEIRIFTTKELMPHYPK